MTCLGSPSDWSAILDVAARCAGVSQSAAVPLMVMGGQAVLAVLVPLTILLAVVVAWEKR